MALRQNFDNCGSPGDIEITRRLREVGDIMGVGMLLCDRASVTSRQA